MAEFGDHVSGGNGSANDDDPEHQQVEAEEANGSSSDANHDGDMEHQQLQAEEGNQSSSEANHGEDPELQQLQAEEEELAQRVSAEVSQELSSHMAKLEQELRHAFDERMSALHQQCSTQAAEVISTRQTDILRTNKVLRDVSRALGADWRPVFDSLMAQFPADMRDGALKKVEAERPVLQAYKALMMWKDAWGPDFDVRHILDALRNNGLDELESMTLSILDSDEKESLITFAGFGKKTGPVGSGASVGTSSRNMQAAAAAVPAAEMLDDRHLLLLAKKIGSDWEHLAKLLSVSEDEVSELLSSEGHSYQGAFRMLWEWREASSDLQTSLESLLDALRQLGHSEAAEQIFG